MNQAHSALIASNAAIRQSLGLIPTNRVGCPDASGSNFTASILAAAPESGTGLFVLLSIIFLCTLCVLCGCQHPGASVPQGYLFITADNDRFHGLVRVDKKFNPYVTVTIPVSDRHVMAGTQ